MWQGTKYQQFHVLMRTHGTKMKYMAHIEPCVKWVEKVKEMRGKLVILRRRHRLLHLNKGENVKGGCRRWRNKKWSFSSVRRSSFSLRSLAIGPLYFDGARRENVLRGAGYAWTPDLQVLTNSKR